MAACLTAVVPRTNCSGDRRRQRHLTTEERLITELFREYDVDSRGVVNVSRTVTVEVQFMLLRVQRLVSCVIRDVIVRRRFL